MRVPLAGDAVRIEPAFDVGDDIIVRAQADTGKTDEVGKNVDAALTKQVRNEVCQ